MPVIRFGIRSRLNLDILTPSGVCLCVLKNIIVVNSNFGLQRLFIFYILGMRLSRKKIEIEIYNILLKSNAEVLMTNEYTHGQPS